MPLTYHIDKEQSLIITTAVGVLTDEDVLLHKTQLLKDPDFRPGLRELSDIRSIDRLAVTPIGIKNMVEHDRHHAEQVEQHRLAIVASEDAVFGMGRMYQMMAEPVTESVRIFRDIDEAKAWLGVR